MINLKRQAVTLAETVVALLILALVVTLWSGLVNGGKRLGQLNQERPLDWYLFASELESSDHRFFIRSGRPSGNLVLTSQVSKEDYQLVVGSVVYLRRVAAGGYLPLLRLREGEKFDWYQLDDHRVQFQRCRGGENEKIVVAFEHPPRQQPFDRSNPTWADRRGGRHNQQLSEGPVRH